MLTGMQVNLELTQYNISEDLDPEPLLCRQLQWQCYNNLSHARKVSSYRLLYLKVSNWQLMRSHLESYWGILPSRSNGCCIWGDKFYSHWEEATEFIVLTPWRYWQILSAWLPVWECHVRLGNQGIKLNMTITQSDPNNDMAYKDLHRFEINIMF